MRPVAGWSEGPARLGVEDGGPGKVEIDGDALPRPADIVGLELGEHGLAAEAEARIAARARRLHQLDDGLEPGAVTRIRRLYLQRRGKLISQEQDAS